MLIRDNSKEERESIMKASNRRRENEEEKLTIHTKSMPRTNINNAPPKLAGRNKLLLVMSHGIRRR